MESENRHFLTLSIFQAYAALQEKFMKNNARLLFQVLLSFLVLSLTAYARTSDKIDSKIFKVLDVVDFSGEGTDEICPGDKWEFFGPTRQVTIGEKQKI